MNKPSIILAACLCLAAATSSRAIDTVKTTTGNLSGRITRVSQTEVEMDSRGVLKKIPANEILMIYYDNEPSILKTTARAHLLAGRYNDALETLEKLKPEDVDRPEVAQDVAFYKALCAARLALGGTGTIKDAGSQMAKFVGANPTSYHYLEGSEVVGDLLVAMRLYAKAETYYARLNSAPWPDYRMRGGVAIGRARLAQGKTAEALQAFDQVLAIQASGDLAHSQQLAAKLGKASCAAAAGQPDQAIKTVEGIIADADPEDVDLHARAYNTMGAALRKAGRDKDALLAFLHVDLLYFSIPEAHAEALSNLAELWDGIHNTQRAVAVRRILQERYQNSPWAQQGGN